MPLTVVQRPTPYAASALATSHTVNWTSGPATGNLLLAYVSSDAFGWITSAGWAPLIEYVPTGYMAIWWKIAGGSEPTSFTIQCRDAASGGGALIADSVVVAPVEFSGNGPSNPLDKSATATGTSTAASAGPTAATAQADELAVTLAATWGTGAVSASAWTNSLTEVVDSESNTAVSPTSYLAVGERALSATGAVTGGATISASVTWGAITATILAASAGAAFQPRRMPIA